jgi:hypothetical protein
MTPDSVIVRQALIHAFAMVARPVILEYFPPRSCIASTRIAIECLKAFGIEARPVPCEFYLHIPSLKLLYTSGGSAEVREANKLVVLPTADGGTGWPGHLVAVADLFWIDTAFDQGFASLIGEGCLPAGEPSEINVIELPNPLGPEFDIAAAGEMEDGTEVKIRYLSMLDDSLRDSFRNCRAWETDHLQQAIGRIVRLMQRYLKGQYL